MTMNCEAAVQVIHEKTGFYVRCVANGRLQTTQDRRKAMGARALEYLKTQFPERTFQLEDAAPMPKAIKAPMARAGLTWKARAHSWRDHSDVYLSNNRVAWYIGDAWISYAYEHGVYVTPEGWEVVIKDITKGEHFDGTEDKLSGAIIMVKGGKQ